MKRYMFCKDTNINEMNSGELLNECLSLHQYQNYLEGVGWNHVNRLQCYSFLHQIWIWNKAKPCK